MSPYPPPTQMQQPAQPSVVGPVALTAFASAAMFCLPAVMGGDSLLCCVQNCCASFLAATLGFAPVMFFHRMGGHTTAGIGCLIAFFGVGIGGIVGAIVQAKFPAYDVSELRNGIHQFYDEMARQMEQQGQSFDISREDFVTNMMALTPYFVILVVAFSSLLAGAVGLLAGSMMGRRRHPPPQWPTTQPPTQPPTAPPPPPQPPA